MSAPVDLIRRALRFCHRRFWSQKIKDAIKDAASAIDELERDELRAKLAAYEQAPTVALLEWPAKSWPNLRLVSGAYATSGTSVELIARQAHKGGE